MNELRQKLCSTPTIARVAPFVIFFILTFFQGQLGEASRYWVYLLKTLVGAWLVWAVWPVIPEMRWKFSWEAVVVGVVVCAVWVGLDFPLAKQNEMWVSLGLSSPPEKPPKLWNPFTLYGDGAAMGWFYVAVRILGSSLVVPPFEEAFYRSFLYRFITKPDFETIPLNRMVWPSFIVTALIFGIAHNEWLAGIVCAMAYQWLVIRKGRLGDAMTAHAITNFLLGVWVVWRGAWHFW